MCFPHAKAGKGTYDGEFVEGAGGLDVLEGGLEVLELEVDLLAGGLGVADGLDLEGVDGLELAGDVVGGGLELLEATLDLGDDGLILEHGPVVREVHRRRLLRQHLHPAPRVLVPLLECLQRRRCLAPQAQRRRHLGPVDLERCATWLFLSRGRETSQPKFNPGHPAPLPRRSGGVWVSTMLARCDGGGIVIPSIECIFRVEERKRDIAKRQPRQEGNESTYCGHGV